jgi:hypothetical protein
MQVHFFILGSCDSSNIIQAKKGGWRLEEYWVSSTRGIPPFFDDWQSLQFLLRAHPVIALCGNGANAKSHSDFSNAK